MQVNTLGSLVTQYASTVLFVPARVSQYHSHKHTQFDFPQQWHRSGWRLSQNYTLATPARPVSLGSGTVLSRCFWFLITAACGCVLFPCLRKLSFIGIIQWFYRNTIHCMPLISS